METEEQLLARHTEAYEALCQQTDKRLILWWQQAEIKT